MSQVAEIFLLALFAACYPTLLVAVTLMLFLPNPKRLMFGYLLGAYTMGIGLGVVIVYSLQDSGFENISHHSISPAQDLAFGVILLIVASVLRGGYDERLAERRRQRKERKRKGDAQGSEPWAQRMLGRGSPRVTYAVGVALSFPGVAYLSALHRIAALEAPVAPTVALVIAICLIQQLLLELPLLGYVFAPERTQELVRLFRAWLSRNGRRAALYGTTGLGLFLVVRGVIELL